MKSNRYKSASHQIAVKLALAVMGALLVGLFLVPRQSIIRAADRRVRVPLATDWSHRHMIYSAPRSLKQALRLESEPRYIQQYYRRFGGGNDGGRGGRDPFRRHTESELKRDWSTNMGSSSTGLIAVTVGAGQYPAKFSFDVTSTNANCETPAPTAPAQPDFVVYSTSAAGQAAVVATGTVTFIASPVNADTLTITGINGTRVYDFHANEGFCSVGENCVHHTRNIDIDAANLSSAIAGICFNGTCSPDPNVTATSSGGVTTLAAITAGAAGFTLSTNDVGAMTVAGGNNGLNAQASVIAYSNLYAGSGGCTGTVPQIYWAYNSNGTVVTSPVISGDGSQVAFIHSTPGGASLVLLKWQAAEGSTYNATSSSAPPPDSTSPTGSNYATCKSGSGSCQLTLAFANAVNDTNSSPFYDYINDVLYVGDDMGNVHQFSGVFNGTPTEISLSNGNPWVTLTNASSTDVTTGPIYDSVSGGVYIGDNAGYLYDIACTSGGNPAPCSQSGVTATVNPSAKLSTGGNGVFDSPIVDGTAGEVYAFVSHDVGAGAANRSGVFQFGTNFESGAVENSESSVSSSNTEPTSLFAGDFDNAYYTSDQGSSGSNQPSGNLYVCGTAAGEPTLYQITIATNFMTAGAATAGPTFTNAVAACSSVTEFYNTNDLIFVSVTTGALATIGGSPSGCTAGAGCIMSFTLDDSSPFTIPTTTTAGLAVAGGASGVIVDNAISLAGGGASQVYFSPLTATPQTCGTGGTGGCAVQASQAILH